MCFETWLSVFPAYELFPFILFWTENSLPMPSSFTTSFFRIHLFVPTSKWIIHMKPWCTLPCSCSHICTTILPSSFVSYFAFTHFWFQSTDESTPYNISSGLGYHTALAWQEANKNSNILMQIYSGFKWTIKSSGLGWKCLDLLSLHCSTLKAVPLRSPRMAFHCNFLQGGMGKQQMTMK